MEVFEGRDIFADDFIRQEEFDRNLQNPSEVQRFFEGTTILITGATGFLGRILVEKLLRDCWGLKKMYFLIRSKKGKSVEERFNEQFEGPIYDRLKSSRPNFKDKIAVISADLAEENGIISEEDRKMLVETVNVVFHCAATVRFDEKLRRAACINIKSTKYLLDMAHEMKQLKAFIHVSTAYSNCPQKEIDEKFYPPPLDYKKILNILSLEDNILDKLTPLLLDQFPNTYVFTKIIAEDTIREFGKGLPIAILRPSIVISTYKEPIVGWINNYYGPQGVVFGAGLGLLRTLHCDPKVIADMVPVDLVINAMIALAWDIGQTQGDNPNFERVTWNENVDNGNSKTESGEEIRILNYVSSERNPLTWERFMMHNYNHSCKNYSPYQLWHSSLTLHANYYMDRIHRVFCHYLPALIVDLCALILRKKPILWDAYKKIHKFSAVISYFCTTQWKFEEENVKNLWTKMSKKDKHLFNFNIEELIWEDYFGYYVTGMRVYLVKDSLASLPQGKRRAIRLKVLHYGMITSFWLLILYILYRIFF